MGVKYTDILAELGDVDNEVNEAVRRYAWERAGERIVNLQRKIRAFEKQYGMPYELFYARITTDEEFVSRLRAEHPLWERDFHEWEFYVEELREWLNRLETLSTSSS